MDTREAVKKSIFLFGAGASYDAGCKMSKGMLDELQNLIASKENTILEEVEKDALQFLLSCLEYQNKWRSLEVDNEFIFTPNIEELALVIRRVKNRENFLPYPITGNWADKLIKLETEYRYTHSDIGLFDALENKIKQILIPDWLKHNDTSYLSPIKTFFEDNSDEDFELEIATLNYDLVLESYFESYNMRPWRGFSNGIWRGIYPSSDIPEDFGRVNLYKLHGSLDWVRLVSGEVKLKNDLQDIEKQNIDSKHDPYIIFGHGTKTFSVEPFFSLIHNFKELLKEREYIFVIGYSFFDPYINNLLFEAINTGSKRLIIINPSFGPSELNKKLKGNAKKDLFFRGQDERGDFHNQTLIDYLEKIQSNPFYSEMPEFNINKISGESSIFYIPLGTKDFLKEFFENKADLLIRLVENFDEERKSDEPF